MKGYTMKHLHEIHRTMRCVDKYGHRPEKDGAILLGTLIGKGYFRFIQLQSGRRYLTIFPIPKKVQFILARGLKFMNVRLNSDSHYADGLNTDKALL